MDASATVPAQKAKKERVKKSPLPPRYKVGQKVTTKFTAKVPKAGPFGRRYLFLLPGTEWTVSDVSVPGSGRPVYTLTAAEFTIWRQEYRLKPL